MTNTDKERADFEAWWAKQEWCNPNGVGHWHPQHAAKLAYFAGREAERVKDDNPEFDGTDGAHPAWWRGSDHTMQVVCNELRQILDGKPIGNGVASQPWEGIKRDIERLVAERAKTVTDEHPDDLAVDRFAAAMKAKLAQCSGEYLSLLLVEHIEKGDPLDVGNLAMMLHQRGERVADERKRYAAMVERKRAGMDVPHPPKPEPLQDANPTAYLHQHATGGPCLSFRPSDAHMQEQGWVDTPLYPREAEHEPSPDATAEKARADKAEKALADEREACAKAAEGKSPEFDFQAALAEHRDDEYGYHIGRIAAASAIRARKGDGDE